MHLSVLHHFFNFSQHQFLDPHTVFTSINQQSSSSIQRLYGRVWLQGEPGQLSLQYLTKLENENILQGASQKFPDWGNVTLLVSRQLQFSILIQRDPFLV